MPCKCSLRLTLPEMPATDVVRSYWAELGEAELDESAREFATRLAAGTLQNLELLDERIRSRAEHWRISRMAVVDRNILRLAVYEFLYEPTPRTVAINEALEIARASPLTKRLNSSTGFSTPSNATSTNNNRNVTSSPKQKTAKRTLPMNDDFEERFAQISATIDQLRAASGKDRREMLDALFRSVHSLKAAAHANGLNDLTARAHEFENLLHAVRTGRTSLDNCPISIILKTSRLRT